MKLTWWDRIRGNNVGKLVFFPIRLNNVFLHVGITFLLSKYLPSFAPMKQTQEF